MSEELERIMKKRLVKGGEFPPWFNFEEKGYKIFFRPEVKIKVLSSTEEE